jgi:hypothetical protein
MLFYVLSAVESFPPLLPLSQFLEGLTGQFLPRRCNDVEMLEGSIPVRQGQWRRQAMHLAETYQRKEERAANSKKCCQIHIKQVAAALTEKSN